MFRMLTLWLFLTWIGKEAYNLLKTLMFPDKPISLRYANLKAVLLNYIKCTNFECHEGDKFHKIIHQNIENSTTLPGHPSPMCTQCYADNNSLTS